MGKLKCICENTLSDTCGDDAEIFTEDQIQVIDDSEWYPAGDGRSVLECEKCGTLSIEDPIGSCCVKYYQPENGKFNRLFRV